MLRAVPLVLASLVTIPLLAGLSPPPAQPAAPKTIILGFDGMDHALTQRFMDAGDLPNFKRLAEQGLYQRLETSNPAQSPVSWAVFNTGSNPGKPLPQPMLGFSEKIPADDFVEFPMALKQPGAFKLSAAAVGLIAGLLVGLLLFRLMLGWKAVLAILTGVVGLLGGWFWAEGYVGALPADGKLPYVVNPMQGTNFWTWLDEAGIRLRGIQVASTYPPDDEGSHTTLLSGLGVPDVSGSPGSWFVYTNDPWSYGDKSTQTAGKIIKLYEDQPGRLDGKLLGPRNWVEDVRQRERISRLKADIEGGVLSTGALTAAQEELSAAEREYEQWRRAEGTATVPFSMRLDAQAQAVEIIVGAAPGSDLDRDQPGTTRVRVEQGGWSDFVPVEFVLNERFSAFGNVIFHVIRCDEEETRVFVPPINIDPLNPQPQLPISAPPGFAGELQQQIGHAYETLGWACITNPLKDFEDSRLPQQSFMDDMVSTEALREELLMAGLDRADEWDVYFQVLSTTDRVSHMLFRESDPEHPAHDSELAATPIEAFGTTFPLSDAIRQVYMSEDRLLGRVLERIESGGLGEDVLLLIVSDHGFSSFRRQVNLNNVLADLGHLVLKEGRDVASVLSGSRAEREFLGFVDWSRTRAYSYGLGKVFINLEGREPEGIVPADQYDEVVEAIRRDLLALKDPQSGVDVVTSAGRRDELFSGPWWKEGQAQRKIRGELVDVRHEGFADLFLGYAKYYRVSWSNTMGGLDSEAITDNENHWSGDHVSVDPSHVPGVLFSNRPMSTPGEAHLLDIGPTVLARYGLPIPEEMDGRPLPIENLTP
jgi:predicted AlkP superfamily phosphohydrolase/phosphomutase